MAGDEPPFDPRGENRREEAAPGQRPRRNGAVEPPSRDRPATAEGPRKEGLRKEGLHQRGPLQAATELLPAASTPLPAAAQARLAETWGLGAVATMLLVFVALTGGGLVFFYRPIPELALADLADLREVGRLGFLREWHLWGSHALSIVVILHLVRRFLDGAYRLRPGGWLTGVALLVLVVLLALTGTLLPWTQEGWWGFEAFFGETLGLSPSAGTLFLCYVLHCMVLPAAAGILVLDHLRRARRTGAG